METVKTYLTAREAAEVIGVSYRMILKWIGTGELECHRIGDNDMIRISYEQIADFMSKHRVNPHNNGEPNGEFENLEDPA